MTVGQQLKQARTDRKLSFSDVTTVTKIQPWVLESLESDRLPELMSPVYVKGFLSTYARFLKLDPAPLVAGLRWPQPPEPDAVPLQQQELPPALSKQAAVAPAQAVAAKRAAVMVQDPPEVEEPAAAPVARPKRERPARRMRAFQMPKFQLPRMQFPRVQLPKIRLPRFQLPRIPLPVLRRAAQAVALTGVIAGVIAVHPLQQAKKIPWPTLSLPKFAKAESGGVKKVSAKKASAKKSAAESGIKVQAAKTEDDGTAKPAAPKIASASVAPVGEALKPPVPLQMPAPISTEPLELVVTANRTTWIKVRADGKLLSQQRLSRGANERWTAKKQFEVIISKPSQVELSLNGQSISPFAIAHRGRLLITHRGVTPLPESQD